jgi:hypothetical protein
LSFAIEEPPNQSRERTMGLAEIRMPHEFNNVEPWPLSSQLLGVVGGLASDEL